MKLDAEAEAGTTDGVDLDPEGAAEGSGPCAEETEVPALALVAGMVPLVAGEVVDPVAFRL